MRSTGSCPNLLTIDVEDYFHANGLQSVTRAHWPRLPGRVEYNTRRLLSLLGEQQTTATFFVLGWVAKRNRSLIREIAACGHEIASHGWAHELVYRQTPAAFEADVVRTKEFLEDLTGQRVAGYRAPSFSIVPDSWWALEILARSGHLYDSSVYPVRRARYGVPDAPATIHTVLDPTDGHDGLLEVPPPSVPVLGHNLPVAGGGYLRLYPTWVTRAAIRRLNRRHGRPAVVYLHPWELDPDQPRLPAAPLDRWRHYVNLDRTETRLRALLGEFHFTSIAQYLDVPIGGRSRTGAGRQVQAQAG